MTGRGLYLLFGAVLALFLVIRFPLEASLNLIGLAESDIDYARASGSVWSGELKDVRWRDRPVGDFRLDASPAGLALGRMSLDVKALDGGPLSMSGTITRTMVSGTAGKNVRVSALIEDLPTILGLRGRLDLEISRLAVAGDGCSAADMTLTVTAAAVDTPSGARPLPNLEGRGVCRGRDVEVTLAGEDSDVSLAADMRVQPDGAFDLRIKATTQNPTISAGLALYGFRIEQQDGGVLVFTQSGRWSRS